MKLSLVIPVYKVEKYILRCLKSIFDQAVDTSLYEIIIVDDESPDNSVVLIHEYCKNLNNITVVSQKNSGLGGARNTGLTKATGEYVWFIDSDDTITENSIEKVLSSITTKADIYVFDVNKITSNCVIRNSAYNTDIENKRGCDIVNYLQISQVWRNVYKRDFLIKHGLQFKEHFLHEDGEFNMRAVTIASRVSYLRFPVYNYYTTNNSSIMNNIRFNNQADLLAYFASANEFRHKNELNTQQKTCLQKYLQDMLGLLFKNVLYLSSADIVQFRKLLKQYQPEINKTIREERLFDFLKVYSMSHFVSKKYYNIIFNKSLIIR